MLRIKLDKSEILLVGIVENIEILALELGCKGALPSTYLGLPLRAPHKSVVVWDGVEERFQKRLVCGKDNIFLNERESLSFGVLCLTCPFTSCL